MTAALVLATQMCDTALYANIQLFRCIFFNISTMPHTLAKTPCNRFLLLNSVNLRLIIYRNTRLLNAVYGAFLIDWQVDCGGLKSISDCNRQRCRGLFRRIEFPTAKQKAYTSVMQVQANSLTKTDN